MSFSSSLSQFILSAPPHQHLGRVHGIPVCVDSFLSMSVRSLQFDSIVSRMKVRYAVRVKRWRRQMSGCAWSVRHADGRCVNWIEAPHPRTPISLAIFLHEVGHHAIGFKKYRMRCEEEYHVWVWALGQMRKLGVEPDAKVNKRFELSMQYAVGKAIRRGLKKLPEPLGRFVQRAA